MHKRVRIFDTTLRDGEQTPGVHLTEAQKADIAGRLEAFGVDTIEAGFPISSPGDKAAVARIAREVRACEVAALARCVSADIAAAAESLKDAAVPVIHVFLGTSDIHLTKKLRINRAQAVRAIEASVRQARREVNVVQFTPEDSTRTERTFLRQCIGVAIENGATRINIADTVGCATPREFGALIRDVVNFAGPAVMVSAHCHNDMGMATANSITAVENGAGQIEATVNGIGERAGNAAIEEVAVALALKGIASTNIDAAHITDLCRHVSAVTGVPIQPNRAIVGAHAFAHSSGIHQDGILKDPQNYEFVPPSFVGAPGHRFVLTARSGRSAIGQRAAAMGRALASEQVEAIYDAFIRVADATRGAVPETALDALIRQFTDHDACASNA
jgi:2-isopropylmalate synthase